MVPAVSIMSSVSRQSFPSTSPITFITSATLAEGRRLSMIPMRGAQPLGEAARHLGRPHVRRHRHQVGEVLVPEVLREHRRRVQVVHRDVEEPLQLVLVEVHAEHPVAPAEVIRLATSLAPMATRGWSLRSCRA
jgi:hypothetical protein